MLYLDASALVKRYVEEEGSKRVLDAMSSAAAWSTCRIGYVETIRAVSKVVGGRAAKRVESDWPAFNVVEVDVALVEHAAELACSTELRSLDALHLAAALVLPPAGLTVATWDVRLHRAARDKGLTTLPESLD